MSSGVAVLAIIVFTICWATAGVPLSLPLKIGIVSEHAGAACEQARLRPSFVVLGRLGL